MKRYYSFFLLPVFWLGFQGAVLGQTEADVGDLASFGKDVRFFGYAAGGTVLIARDCAGWLPELGPDDRCFTINAATNTVSFDAREVGRIRFPAKTFQTVIYLLGRSQYSYYFQNFTTQSKSGRFQSRPYLTLESDALSDPALINPQTGQPFNGKVDISTAGLRSFTKTILPNYQESDAFSVGAASLSGITRKYLMDTFNLPAVAADKLFDGKITIYLNIKGSATNVEEGTFNYAARVVGN